MAAHKSAIKIGAYILGLVILVSLFTQLNVSEYLLKLLEWIPTLGIWAPVIFILIYIVATIAFVPGLLLTMGAGVLFGVVNGTLYVSLASILGATFAFLLGRNVAGKWVAKEMNRHPKFKAIEMAVAKQGWKIVGLVRLSPLFPFNLLNYAFGLTKVKMRDYFFASWIGMLPGTLMYVYIGSLAGSLATLGGGRERMPMEWVLYIVGLLATVIVTIYVTKIAKKALDKQIQKHN